MSQNCLHLAVGMALASDILNMGILGLVRVGTGIAPSRPSRPPTTPGTPPPAPPHVYISVHGSAEQNSVVGLISVGQLSLVDHFSGLLGITEVYNLLRIDRIINHSCIPGNE